MNIVICIYLYLPKSPTENSAVRKVIADNRHMIDVQVFFNAFLKHTCNTLNIISDDIQKQQCTITTCC